MKKIKGKSLLIIAQIHDKNKRAATIDMYQQSNGEYVCVIANENNDGESIETTISDSNLIDFMDKLKDYPKAVEFACEIFFAELMEEPCGYDKSVLECLKRVYERDLSIINQEINKEVRNEHFRD